MHTTHIPATVSFSGSWREIVMPKEHGSWSLAFEPLLLGLLVAPTAAGAMLALAVAAAFFARRPFKLSCCDHRADRRAHARGALLVCALISATCFALALGLNATTWALWLGPSLLLGFVFLWFDVRNAGREELAEVAGSAAFALLPAALAAMAGADSLAALSVGVVMLSRSVPTVVLIRARLRGAKTGRIEPVIPLALAVIAVVVTGALARAGLAPAIAVVLLGALLLRAVGLMLVRATGLRARTIGMIEAVAGVVFVLTAGLAWRL